MRDLGRLDRAVVADVVDAMARVAETGIGNAKAFHSRELDGSLFPWHIADFARNP